ncbi:MAG: methylenetetrahydrofolate reductase C-terminal domain-containing protein [Desulfohalobiaceae bacterium]|nr:methylenetetrahydrofolate reductase C-terminal domain-containing protein [Desulfohalobiaceae bacterium]
MIVAQRKPFPEILSTIRDYEKILTVGCGTCVAVCLAGGAQEVSTLNWELSAARSLRDQPLELGEATVTRQCDHEFLAELDSLVQGYQALLSMACGVGIQFLAERYPDKPVLPAVDTSGMSGNRDVGWYEERCRGCGRCVLASTAGVCPITMCAKGLLNGPCGGTSGQYCETNPDQPCAWHTIYHRLAGQGRLKDILEYQPPQEWRNQVPRTIVQPGYGHELENEGAETA